jgi:hypothetical protein
MKRIFLLLVLMISVSAFLNAQVNFSAKTGDGELDLTLGDMNTNAKANLTVFKKDLSLSFNIGIARIDQLMLNYKMEPADIYLTLQIGQQTGKTPDQVAECYKKNKGKGWGVIAQEMGIKPGSAEFHALKDKAKGKNNKMKEKGKGNGNKGNGKGKSK